MLALSAVVLCAGCVHWSGPSRVRVRRVVISWGQESVGTNGLIDYALKRLFERDSRFTVDLVGRANVGSRAAACALGHSQLADLVMWRDDNKKLIEAQCLGRVGRICTNWFGTENSATVTVAYHATAIGNDGECTTRDLPQVTSTVSASPYERGIQEVENAANANVGAKLTLMYDTAFGTGLTITRTNGDVGTVKRSGFRVGDTLRVMRAGNSVGDVVVTAAGATSTVQAYSHDVDLETGDHLEVGDRWCCASLVFGSTVRHVERAFDAHTVAGASAQLRWFAAPSSPMFEAKLEGIFLGTTRLYHATLGGGWRHWLVPRWLSVSALGGAGLAFGTRDVDDMKYESTRPLAFARVGAELRLTTDLLWLYADIEVDTHPRHNDWYDKVDGTRATSAEDPVAVSWLSAGVGLALRY